MRYILNSAAVRITGRSGKNPPRVGPALWAIRIDARLAYSPQVAQYSRDNCPVYSQFFGDFARGQCSSFFELSQDPILNGGRCNVSFYVKPHQRSGLCGKYPLSRFS